MKYNATYSPHRFSVSQCYMSCVYMCVEWVSGATDETDGGELCSGVLGLSGHHQPSGGEHPQPEGRDSSTPARVPGPAQRQDSTGHRDRHLQEDPGGQGEPVRH